MTPKQSIKSQEASAICGLCPHGCWVLASISDGILKSVRADSDPRYGNLCERGRLSAQIVYSENRIKTPLIRTGPKGTLAFRQATWDEALDQIAHQFKAIRDKHGASALASYMGAGTLEDSISTFFKKFLEPFGSPNDMDCGSVCYVSSKILAPVTTLGIEGCNFTSDFENANVIVLWGTNPLKDGLPDKMRRIQAARKRGAKLIIIDPRRHRLAKVADLWVPVLPGTDGALALALINVIISRGWQDRKFVDNWTTGFDELTEYASLFSPEVAGNICGIDASTIEWLAETIASASGVSIDFYSGLEFAASGVQNMRAIYSLIALTGNLDADGGLLIKTYPHAPCKEFLPDLERPPVGAREYPLFYALTGKAHMAGLAAAVLKNDPYPVRGLLLVGGSPYLSYPDPANWRRIYESLDFMAVIDRFLPEEAAWADVILPASTYYETNSFQFYRTHLRLRHKLIEPVGHAMGDSLILAAIAERLGIGRAFPQSEKEMRQHALAGDPDLIRLFSNGADIVELLFPEHRVRKYETGHLRSDGQPGFPTPTGKFEFKSTLLERYGYDPLPLYKDPRSNDIDGWRGLILTTGARSRARFNSQYLDRPELAAKNRAVLEINPLDAGPRGINNGGTVMVFTEKGRITLKAHVTSAIRTGSVHVFAGGGGRFQSKSWRNANVNSIIPPDRVDPISGYPVCKAAICEVVADIGDMRTDHNKARLRTAPFVGNGGSVTDQKTVGFMRHFLENLAGWAGRPEGPA